MRRIHQNMSVINITLPAFRLLFFDQHGNTLLSGTVVGYPSLVGSLQVDHYLYRSGYDEEHFLAFVVLLHYNFVCAHTLDVVRLGYTQQPKIRAKRHYTSS